MRETKRDSKGPEDVSPAMLQQGILTRYCVLPSPRARWIPLQILDVHPHQPNWDALRGSTRVFDRRIMQHKMDTIEGFTKKYQVHRLVYYESFDHAANAISREKQLKGWRRAKKIALIEKVNPRWQDLAEKWGSEMRFRGSRVGRTP